MLELMPEGYFLLLTPHIDIPKTRLTFVGENGLRMVDNRHEHIGTYGKPHPVPEAVQDSRLNHLLPFLALLRLVNRI